MMTDGLVAIARYHSSSEANLARARLASAGIDSTLADETGVEVSGELENSLPLQLAVTRTRARQALEILRQAAAEPAPEPKWSDRVESERCPVCESSFIEVQEAGMLGQIFRAVLTSLIPLPASALESKSRSCGVCRHRWKSAAEGGERPGGPPPGGPPPGPPAPLS